MRHYLLTKFNAALPAFSIPMAIASVEIPKYGIKIVDPSIIPITPPAQSAAYRPLQESVFRVTN